MVAAAPLDEIGKQFSDGKLFVPEMLRAAQTMKAGLEVLRPFLEDADREAKGTLVIGTVKGDLHDILVLCNQNRHRTHSVVLLRYMFGVGC